MVEVKKEENGNETAAPAATNSTSSTTTNTSAGSNTQTQSEGSQSKQLEPEHFRKLFIGGLSLNTTDENLKSFYSQFGELLDCVVMRDGQSKKSRGFGFVTFSSREEVDSAMKARPHELDGKTVDPKRAVPRDQSNRSESNISTKRLYVSGVREEHKEEDFSSYFDAFGKVLKVEIITDKATDKPRGFAFVTFDDYDSVDQCVLLKSHMINNYRCDVKKALSKDEIARSQQMDRDRMDRGGRSRGNQRPPQSQWNGRGGGGGSGGGGGGGGGGGYGRDGGYGGWAGPQAWQGYNYGGGYGGAQGGGWGGPAWPAGGGPPGAASGWGASGGAAGWSGDGTSNLGPGGQWGAPGGGSWAAQSAAGGGWAAPGTAGGAGGAPPAGGPRF